MNTEETINLVKEVYKKTLSYELDSLRLNPDGTSTLLHSDAFLDEHPDRKNSPEYTEEEELKVYKFIAEMAKRF